MSFTIPELEVELRTLAARKSQVHNELQQITGACAIVEQMIILSKQKEMEAEQQAQPSSEISEPLPEPIQEPTN